MSEQRVVLHIGAHKTGTTMLQRQFFPTLPDCVFLTHGGRTSTSLVKTASTDLCHDDDFDAATFGVMLREMRGSAGTVLLSHEGFAGEPFRGTYNRFRTLDRLFAAAPDALVVMGVREQSSMLRSLYNQNIVRGGYSSLEDVLSGRAPATDLSLDYLRYDDWVEGCHSRFGHDRVLVLPYERLREDRTGYLRELGSFVLGREVDPPPPEAVSVENASLSPVSRSILRWANHNFRKTSVNPEPRVMAVAGADRLFHGLQRQVDPRLFADTPRRLSDSDEALLVSVAESLAAVNTRLGALTGLDLSTWGYRVTQDEPQRTSPGGGERG